MEYEGDIIRPPSEADAIILQVTVGCSHNRCTFCGAYAGVSFRLRDEERIRRDIDFAARHCRRQSRLFFADGNVLCLPQRRLTGLCRQARERLPWVRRLGLYANARDVLAKSPVELDELRALGLRRVYLGLESGDAAVLAAVDKGSGPEEMITAARRLRAANIFVSVTVLLGLAGQEGSHAHAVASGRVLSEMRPHQIAILSYMPLPGAPLGERVLAGEHPLPDTDGLLAELETMIEHISCDRVQLHSNHASNFLPLEGRLQRDRPALLSAIRQARAGKVALRPEWMRGL